MAADQQLAMLLRSAKIKTRSPQDALQAVQHLQMDLFLPCLSAVATAMQEDCRGGGEGLRFSLHQALVPPTHRVPHQSRNLPHLTEPSDSLFQGTQPLLSLLLIITARSDTR